MNRSTVFLAGTALLVVAAAAVSSLLLNRAVEERSLDRLWFQLEHPRGTTPFGTEMVDGLPEPARRFFIHAIAPGTPLAESAVLHMHGSLERDGRALPMKATQVLAPPRGFVWRADVGSGLMRIRGYDRYAHARGAMRWWLHGLIPVVSSEGPDVARSAAGRLAGEGILVPSSLLPQRGVRWEAVDDTAARAIMEVDGERIVFTVGVGVDGRPRSVTIQRWNSDAANGPVGYLPFFVEFGDALGRFGGYTIPTELRAGWVVDGTFRPFFVATLDDATYH
jgi:hypothetical protein